MAGPSVGPGARAHTAIRAVLPAMASAAYLKYRRAVPRKPA